MFPFAFADVKNKILYFTLIQLENGTAVKYYYS